MTEFKPYDCDTIHAYGRTWEIDGVYLDDNYFTVLVPFKDTEEYKEATRYCDFTRYGLICHVRGPHDEHEMSDYSRISNQWFTIKVSPDTSKRP